MIDFSKDKCRNCYKCVHACPVKAIQLKDKHAHVMADLCIGCGECLKICPQQAQEIKSDLSLVKEWLKKEAVVVSLSDCFITATRLKHPGQYLGALRQLGFTVIEELSVGQEALISENEKVAVSEQQFVIDSSCTAINNLIQGYYPQYTSCLSPVLSPVIAHGKILKQKYPQAKIIFIGSCLAVKNEIKESGIKDLIDGVLTFDELNLWFKEVGIEPTKAATEEFDAMGMGTLSGDEQLKSSGEKRRHFIQIEGVNRSIEFLREMKNLKERYWIEMKACPGGCINGPGNLQSPYSSFQKREIKNSVFKGGEKTESKNDFSGIDFTRSFKRRPVRTLQEISQRELEIILKEMRKFKVQDELNCGMCGYDSCREKARAVYFNLSEADKCFPMIFNKNEMIANSIFTRTPNAIVILDKKFRIIEFNDAAEKLFNVKRAAVFRYAFEDVLGYNPFKKLDQGGNNYTGKGKYEKGNRIFLEVLSYSPELEMYVGLFIDVSKQEKQERAYLKMQEETLAMAQQVIDKQMRVAHEIAGLLGETTAETKVTLTKLQKVIRNREGEF